MSNLAKGQTAWSKLFREFGLPLGVDKQLCDVERKFSAARGRIQVVEQNDTAASTSAWALSGVVIGTNTDEDGLIYVRITDESPGAGQATVNLYKTTGGGGGDKVATGSAANGAVVTLTASNSSGLTGTVTLGTVGASESDDKHRLLVLPDWTVRARSVFDLSESEHAALLREWGNMCQKIEGDIRTARGRVSAFVSTLMGTRIATFNRSGETTAISRDTVNDENAIETVFTGLLEIMRDNMADETSPAAQTILKRTVTAGSASFDSSNQGLGALSTPTMAEWAGDGLITLTCVDGTIGAEQFRLTQRLDVTGESREADNYLTVKRAFADPKLGITATTLTRTHTFTGSTNDISTTSSDWTFNGESSANTNDGILYLKVTGSTGAWVVSAYTSTTYDTSVRVWAATAGAAAATVAFSGSGMTGTLKIGTAPTTGNTATVNLNPFRTNGTNGVPDKITVDVTVTRLGEFQERLTDLFGYKLNSAASSETIDDSYVTAGTFPPYEVADA